MEISDLNNSKTEFNRIKNKNIKWKSKRKFDFPKKI